MLCYDNICRWDMYMLIRIIVNNSSSTIYRHIIFISLFNVDKTVKVLHNEKYLHENSHNSI